MRLIIVSVDFLEAAILMAEVASFAIGTELLTVELPAILRLIFVIKPLFLFVKNALMSITHFFNSMSVLTLWSISADPSLIPVLAHLTLVHRSFDKAFRAEEIYEHPIGLRALLKALLLLRFFDWRNHVLWHCGYKSLCLLNIHSLERIDFGGRKLHWLEIVGAWMTGLKGHAIQRNRCRSTNLHA